VEDVKRVLVQFLSGPLFLLFGLWLGYEWMFNGTSWWLWGVIPISPLLIFSSLGLGAWMIKMGYIDRNVDAILDFWKD
jgi:hypothetical protein